MGLVGEALIPKYVSSWPLVQAVRLNSEAVPERAKLFNDPPWVPVIAKIRAPGMGSSLLGTNISTRKSPVWGPGEMVKPKFGGFVLVGVFVPLSIQAGVDP